MNGDSGICIIQLRFFMLPMEQISKFLFNRAGKSQIRISNDQKIHQRKLPLFLDSDLMAYCRSIQRKMDQLFGILNLVHAQRRRLRRVLDFV